MKKRPTAERICGWQKKLPQMVGFMYEMLGFFGLEMPKEGLFWHFDAYIGSSNQIEDFNPKFFLKISLIKA